jgi:O-antigen ligase
MSAHTPSKEADYLHWPRLPRIYPLNTRPLTDLKAALLGLPALWLLGLEQVVLPLLVIWAACKLPLRQSKLRLPLAAIPFILFLIWQIVPQVTLEGSRDWIVSGRNMVAYVAALCILLILANDVKNLQEVYSLIYAMIGLSLVSAGVAVLFILGVLPQEFQAALVKALLPGALQGSRFVQESIIIREIGRQDALFGPFVYPRISGLFLSANNAAIGYTCLLYWQWWLLTTARRFKWWLSLLLFAFSALVFLFTGSRIAWLAFVIAFGLMYALRYQVRLRLPAVTLPLAILTLTLSGILFFLFTGDQTGHEWVNTFFLDVREGSFRARLILYETTIALWLERPIIGWGVSKPVASVSLAPVGTHNELLGMLFRSGLVGFTLYLFVLISIWLQISLRIKQAVKAQNRVVWQLCLIVTAVFLSLNIMHLAYSFYWDASVLLLTWTTVGLIYSKPLAAERSD